MVGGGGGGRGAAAEPEVTVILGAAQEMVGVVEMAVVVLMAAEGMEGMETSMAVLEMEAVEDLDFGFIFIAQSFLRFSAPYVRLKSN